MRLNSGESAPKSGAYRVVNQYGQTMNTVELSEGQTMPPTQSSEYHFEID